MPAEAAEVAPVVVAAPVAPAPAPETQPASEAGVITPALQHIEGRVQFAFDRADVSRRHRRFLGEVVGHGKQDPLDPRPTTAAKALNRRVEFNFVSP